MYRLFIALDMPGRIKNDLKNLCGGIPGAKWVDEDQLHITLRFIGEVDGSAFNDIKECLSDVKNSRFTMRLKGVGSFPPGRTPKILWAGVEDKTHLVRLHNSLESVLVECGLDREHRKFHPHITLARLNNPSVRRVADFLSVHSMFKTAKFTISEFHLYSSILTPKGAVHNLEVSYPLMIRQIPE